MNYVANSNDIFFHSGMKRNLNFKEKSIDADL
jgi:hypothetical protein